MKELKAVEILKKQLKLFEKTFSELKENPKFKELMVIDFWLFMCVCIFCYALGKFY